MSSADSKQRTSACRRDHKIVREWDQVSEDSLPQNDISFIHLVPTFVSRNNKHAFFLKKLKVAGCFQKTAWAAHFVAEQGYFLPKIFVALCIFILSDKAVVE